LDRKGIDMDPTEMNSTVIDQTVMDQTVMDQTVIDPIKIMRHADGGGEVWDQIERRLQQAPAPSQLALLLERLGLDGSLLEAAVWVPGPAPVLALSAALVLLGSGLFTQSGLGQFTAITWLLAPVLGVLAGAIGFRHEFDPASELTRTSTSTRGLLLARQTLVYAILCVVLLPFLPWLPGGLLQDWLLPTLCLNALALALSLRFGPNLGLSFGFGLWLWLALLHIPSETQAYIPAFLNPNWQTLILLASLLWAVWHVESRFSRRQA
jgi:hypothetical protein